MPMATDALEAKVKQILVEYLGCNHNEVSLDADIVNDLGADSLDSLELVIAFEDCFDIDIPYEDEEKIKTVRDIVVYLQDRRV